MAPANRSWRPDSSAAEDVANLRVCLALLRIYRSVQLPHDEMDMADVARPFWPLVRQHRTLFKAGMEGARVRAYSRGPRSRPRVDEEIQEQLEEYVSKDLRGGRSLPLEPPEAFVLAVVGEALLLDTPRFRPLVKALEGDLSTRVASTRHPMDDNIDLLVNLLQLSAEEGAFFRLCAATHCSSIGTAPFAFARWPIRLVEAVQAALCTKDEYAVRSMMRRSSRLLRSGLLDVESFSSRHDMEDVLRLSRQALLLLSSGTRNAAEMATVILKPVAAPSGEALAWPHLENRAKLLERLLAESLRAKAHGINLLLYGAPGTGKTQFARQLVAKVGAAGFSVSDVDADGDHPAARSDRLSSLMLTQVFAPAGTSVVLLDEAEDVFRGEYNDPLGRMLGKRDEGKSWMNSLLEGNVNPVIWISNRIDNMDPAYVRRFTYCLEFPQTPRGVRRAIAHAHLDATGCSDKVVETVASDAGVSPAMLASAARFSQLAKLSGPAVDEAVTAMLADMVNAMGMKPRSNVPERSTRFDLRYLNIKGAATGDAVMGALERSGRGRILLSGPAGTGKTQFAAEVAQRLGKELVYKTASDLNSMWFGQSERNVARMFQDCDPAGEVLFLDEADTLLGVRDSSANRPEIAVTAEFLRQVESFKGVFVCATNFFDAIDPALLRRFEYRLELLPLALTQRLDLFCETALGWDGAVDTRPPVDQATQARLGKMDLLTPGDFANVVRRVTALRLELDLQGWVNELQAEHDSKPGARRALVGFV